MLNSIRGVFSAPSFENEQQNRTSYLLNFVTIAYLAISLVTVAASLAGSTSLQQTLGQAIPQSAPLVAAVIIAQILLRSRRVRAASITFGVLLWLSQTYNVYTSGGAGSYFVANYVLAIMVFGLLLGRRYAIATAIASVLTSVVILALGTRHLLPQSVYATSDPAQLSMFTFFFEAFLAASLIYLYTGLLDQSLRRLRAANQELQNAGTLLEQRVNARTKDLETVAEVSTATATILESDRLLQEVVDVTKKRFNLYHSHIYLLNPAGDTLVLAAGSGEPGRKMVAERRSIPLNREQSLVARAARERKGVTVNDVTQAPDFLPNPLLPETHAELAVPMIAAGNLVGVFDIQSDQVGRFGESDISIQTALAAQVAVSIQNVRRFEQSRAQAEMETVINAIGQKIQRTVTMEEALQTAIRELGLAVGASRVKATIDRPLSADPGAAH